MNTAQSIWNDTMSTLRLNQRKHAVHRQAEKRPDPELHLIGEIVSASGFGPNGVSCRYEFVTAYVLFCACAHPPTHARAHAWPARTHAWPARTHA